LRHCASSWKAADSIPDEITMALGSTQPLTEMSTRNLSVYVISVMGRKGGRTGDKGRSVREPRDLSLSTAAGSS
jgi:hypothetical protein